MEHCSTGARWNENPSIAWATGKRPDTFCVNLTVRRCHLLEMAAGQNAPCPLPVAHTINSVFLVMSAAAPLCACIHPPPCTCDRCQESSCVRFCSPFDPPCLFPLRTNGSNFEKKKKRQLCDLVKEMPPRCRYRCWHPGTWSLIWAQIGMLAMVFSSYTTKRQN